MAFRTNPAPYQRAKHSTTQIMLILVAALALVWLCGVVYSFRLDSLVKAAGKTSHYGLNAILLMVVALLTTAVCDVCTTILKHKTGKGSLVAEIVNDLKFNYSYVSAVIFVLTVPAYTPVYVVIIGSVFATAIVKNIFGGFGKNIFNPAAMARIFVALCFGSAFSVPEVIKATSAGIDGVTGATLTTAFNNASGWLATSVNNNYFLELNRLFVDYSVGDLLLGTYLGALGETFTILILVLGVALSVLKVINWRTPAFYLGTVAITAFFIAIFCGFSNPFLYVLAHLSLGGLAFGAVFMLTDPVTGPTSQFGKAFIGVVAGLLTVLIRVKGGYPEGVVYSIAICNLISPAIDYLTKGRSTDHLVRKYAILGGGVLVSVLLCTLVGFSANGGKEVYYAANGFSAVEDQFLTENVKLEDGQTLAKVDNYQAKTSIVASLSDVEKAGYKGISNCYDIMQGNTKVGIAFVAKYTGEVDTEGYKQQVTTYALISATNDGKLLGVKILSGVTTKGYGMYGTVVEKAESLTNDDLANDIIVAGASYSAKNLQEMINLALKEVTGGTN